MGPGFLWGTVIHCYLGCCHSTAIFPLPTGKTIFIILYYTAWLSYAIGPPPTPRGPGGRLLYPIRCTVGYLAYGRKLYWDLLSSGISFIYLWIVYNPIPYIRELFITLFYIHCPKSIFWPLLCLAAFLCNWAAPHPSGSRGPSALSHQMYHWLSGIWEKALLRFLLVGALYILNCA